MTINRAIFKIQSSRANNSHLSLSLDLTVLANLNIPAEATNPPKNLNPKLSLSALKVRILAENDSAESVLGLKVASSHVLGKKASTAEPTLIRLPHYFILKTRIS